MIMLCVLQSQENQILPDSYAIYLKSLDSNNGNDGIKLVLSVMMEHERFIVFQVSLPLRRLWNYTVQAYGCNEHPLMETTLLSNRIMYMYTIFF